MNTATIRQRLHSYLETADEKKVKAIYTMVEDEINQQHGFVLSEEQVALLDEERAEHVNGTSISYSWDKAKGIIRSKSPR